MAQPVTAILARQSELAAHARRSTGDVNEASLLVGRVICRAFGRFKGPAPEAEISAAMRLDLDAMIEQALRLRH
jgi:hypothetical protein